MRSWPDLYLTCEGGTCPVWWGRTLLQSLHWCLECTLRWPPGTTVVYQTRLSYRSDLCGPWCTCSQGGTLHHQDSLSLHSTQHSHVVLGASAVRVVLYTTGTHCHYTVHNKGGTLHHRDSLSLHSTQQGWYFTPPPGLIVTTQYTQHSILLTMFMLLSCITSQWVIVRVHPVPLIECTHTHIHTYLFIN